MGSPSEDPEAKRDRDRERRMSKLERRQSAEQNASSLTTDIRNVYGQGGISMFNTAGKNPVVKSGSSLFNSATFGS